MIFLYSMFTQFTYKAKKILYCRVKLARPKQKVDNDCLYFGEFKAPIYGTEDQSFNLSRHQDTRFRLTISFSFTVTSVEKSFLFEIEIDVFTDFTFSTAPLSVDQLYQLYLLASNAAKGRLNEKIIPFGTGKLVAWKPVPFSDVETKLLALMKPVERTS